MDGGQEIESLYALTGMPTMKVDTAGTSADDLWNLLSSSD
jgi:hypothetical protein